LNRHLIDRIALAGLAFALIAPLPAGARDQAARVARILKATPLIDGHNDWAETARDEAGDKRWTLDLTALPAPYNTDITRLKAGMVGGQFWSVFVDADKPGLVQVEQTLEQVDWVKSIIARYPGTFELARTAADVRRIHAQGKIASMIGVEGGGQIDGNMSVLRAYRDLGASYLTLTHVKTISWADSATDNPQHNGLTPLGKQVVHELNRLGMLVDLSHVSEATMRDALAVSKAPVIFSHSSARGIDGHTRNVSDDILKRVAANGGVVMVNFAEPYISEPYRLWAAEAAAEKTRLNAPPYGGLFVGEPDRAAAAYADWLKAHPTPRVTLTQVADHIDYIAKVAGVDHVGLGSDFDGVGNQLPDGLSSVATYPALLAELLRRGWSDVDVAKLAGGNVLRVMDQAERVARDMAREPFFTPPVAR